MSDFPSSHWIDNQIKSAAQINTGMRRTSKVLQDVLMRLVHGDTVPADGTSAVLGGLVASAVAGTMRSRLTRGALFQVESTLYTDPLSEYGLAYLEEDDTTTLVHSTADSSNDRYDLITIATATGTTHADTVTRHPDAGGGTLNQALIREAVATIAVVTGTAASSPTVPATPAGAVALWAVLVPANETNASNFTYYDARTRVRPVGDNTKVINTPGARMYVDVTSSFSHAAVGPGGFGQFVIAHTDGTGETVDCYFPIDMPGGGKHKLVGMSMQYRIETAGASGTLDVVVRIRRANAIGTSALSPSTQSLATSAGGMLTVALNVGTDEIIVDDGDAITVQIATTFAGSADGAVYTISMITSEWLAMQTESAP